MRKAGAIILIVLGVVLIVWLKLPQHTPSDQSLREARDLLQRMVEDNRPKPLQQALTQPLIKKTEIAEAKANLEYVRRHDATNEREATELLAGINNAEAAGKKVAQAAIDKAIADDAEGRKLYAKEYEKKALLAGYSVTVSTSGPKATTFNLKYAGLTKASVYQTLNNADLQAGLRQQGFRRLNVSDGYEWSGHVDLK
jgi:hypothetical protein